MPNTNRKKTQKKKSEKDSFKEYFNSLSDAKKTLWAIGIVLWAVISLFLLAPVIKALAIIFLELVAFCIFVIVFLVAFIFNSGNTNKTKKKESREVPNKGDKPMSANDDLKRSLKEDYEKKRREWSQTISNLRLWDAVIEKFAIRALREVYFDNDFENVLKVYRPDFEKAELEMTFRYDNKLAWTFMINNNYDGVGRQKMNIAIRVHFDGNFCIVVAGPFWHNEGKSLPPHQCKGVASGAELEKLHNEVVQHLLKEYKATL